jgi:hypothetical protein
MHADRELAVEPVQAARAEAALEFATESSRIRPRRDEGPTGGLTLPDYLAVKAGAAW